MVHNLPENFNISDFDVFHSALILSLEVAFTLLPTMPSLILDILSTKICTLHVKLWVKRTDMAQF